LSNRLWANPDLVEDRNMKREQKLMVSSAFHGLLVLHIRFGHLSFSLGFNFLASWVNFILAGLEYYIHLRLAELVTLAGLLRLLFFQTVSALSPLFYRKCKIHLSWLIEIVEEKTRGKITDWPPTKTNAEEFQRGKTVAAKDKPNLN